MGNLFNLTSKGQSGSLERKVVVKTIKQEILNRIKRNGSAPTEIRITIGGTEEECTDISTDIFVWTVHAMAEVAKKRNLNVSPQRVVATVSVTFCARQEQEQKQGMTFQVKCLGSRPSIDDIVTDPNATRKSEVNGSINCFDNVNQLCGMGLNYDGDNLNPAMRVLWQFNGLAEEDLEESLRISIFGGGGNAVLDKTTRGKNSYSILRFQDHITIKGALKKPEGSNNDPDILYVNNCGFDGDIVEAKFDNGIRKWSYILRRNVKINDEICFGGEDSDLEHEFDSKTYMTVGGFTLCLEPFGSPDNRWSLRRVIGIFACTRR